MKFWTQIVKPNPRHPLTFWMLPRRKPVVPFPVPLPTAPKSIIKWRALAHPVTLRKENILIRAIGSWQRSGKLMPPRWAVSTPVLKSCTRDRLVRSSWVRLVRCKSVAVRVTDTIVQLKFPFQRPAWMPVRQFWSFLKPLLRMLIWVKALKCYCDCACECDCECVDTVKGK